MGTFASGSPRSTRLTADAFPRLDVYALYRVSSLVDGASTRWQIGETALTVQVRAQASRVFVADLTRRAPHRCRRQ
jgi:hypothetical protein